MRIYRFDFQKMYPMHQKAPKCYFKFSEHGHRNDLSPRNNIYPTPAQDSTLPQPPNCAKGDCFFDSLSTEIELNKDVMSWCRIIPDLCVLFLATSNRLHYAPLIHDNVSSGASCRARVEESYRDLDVWRLPIYVSLGIPPWVHVFSKSTMSSSLQTQSAAIAHSALSILHKAWHNHRLCAKKKFKK